MKTGKETKPAGDIHRRQLFSWSGRSLDLENKNRKVLSDELVRKALEHLRGSLKRGLWLKRPRFPERFEFRGKSFALDLPIACFTEWSLGESLPHTTEYGRIGLGFPKRWVIERGGQSVTYFRHSEKGAFLQSVFRLLGALGDEAQHGVWTPKAATTCFDDLRYLLHFSKMLRLKHPASRKSDPAAGELATGAAAVPPPPPAAAMKPPRKRTKAARESQTFSRRFGRPLQFVEEREWRIVHREGGTGFVKGPGTPEFFLPYIPGDELFTLVVPDNKVLSRVLQEDWFTERLFTPWKHYPQLKSRRVPPVTVLAHSDIGTF